MPDITFATRDPEATDSYLRLKQKGLATWRAKEALLPVGGVDEPGFLGEGGESILGEGGENILEE